MHTHLHSYPSPDGCTSANRMSGHSDIVRFALAAKRLQISEATLRDIRFYSEERKTADGTMAPCNGFAAAFLKLGRAVYVDIPAFVEIWRSQHRKEDARG